MEYRREIDGLRALAVIPVMLFHAGFEAFGGGYVGVDVFFVISGYLITSIILTERQAGSFSIVGFYERRARRILPALFLMMFACLPLAWYWMLPGDMKEFSQSLIAVSLFGSNLLFWRQSGYFDTAAELKPLLHTWSLAVEEQYYLFFPLFLILVWKAGKRKGLVMLVALMCVSFALAQWGTLRHPSATFFLLPTRGWELLMGALVAYYLFSSERKRIAGGLLADCLGAIGLLLIGYAIVAFTSQTPFPGAYAFVPTAGVALIILFATKETIVGKLLGGRMLVGIGLISYSAYLWHQPLIAFSKHASAVKPDAIVLVALLISSLALAYLSWRFVELPFRDRRRFTRRQVFMIGALASVLFLAMGVIGNQTAGFSYRYEIPDRELAELQFSEAGKYTTKRFDEQLLKEFDRGHDKVKVLVIGDSFAMDLVNAVYEAAFTSSIQLSTGFVSHKCGNLFLAFEVLKPRMHEADVPLCQGNSLYEDARIRTLMSRADEIWYVSAWEQWNAELLPRSVKATKMEFGKNVRVFGRKHFGSFTIKSLLSKSASVRATMKGTISSDSARTNSLMKATLSADDFVDVSGLLCGEESHDCRLFTNNGELMSYDGVHLTKHGARYLGEQLAQHPSLAHLHGH